MSRLISVFASAFLFVGALASARAAELSVALNDGTSIPVRVFPARGTTVLVWLPSEVGITHGDRDAARALARRGVEVWLAHVLEARFLPELKSSIEQVPPGDVAALIARAHATTHKRVLLLGPGHGALLALRGASAWRAQGGDPAALAGAILLSPNLYTEMPAVGQEAQYFPAVTRAHLPIYILQPAQSPLRWWVERLKHVLEQGGSRVTVRLLPGVRDRFYFRPSPESAEDAMARRLPGLLLETVNQLEREHS